MKQPEIVNVQCCLLLPCCREIMQEADSFHKVVLPCPQHEELLIFCSAQIIGLLTVLFWLDPEFDSLPWEKNFNVSLI